MRFGYDKQKLLAFYETKDKLTYVHIKAVRLRMPCVQFPRKI